MKQVTRLELFQMFGTAITKDIEMYKGGLQKNTSYNLKSTNTVEKYLTGKKLWVYAL